MFGVLQKSLTTDQWHLTFYRLRDTTWNRLKMLQNGVLSKVMKTIMEREPIAPVLAEAHYQAMDRRLAYIIETVHQCMERFEESDVLVSDEAAK